MSAEWINPATGSVIRRDSFLHAGGDRTVTAPEYSIDIALRTVVRTQGCTEEEKT